MPEPETEPVAVNVEPEPEPVPPVEHNFPAPLDVDGPMNGDDA